MLSRFYSGFPEQMTQVASTRMITDSAWIGDGIGGKQVSLAMPSTGLSIVRRAPIVFAS
jgi:hypothetical protein